MQGTLLLPETAVPLKPAAYRTLYLSCSFWSAVCIVWRARRVRSAGAGVRAPELRRGGVPPLGGVDVSAALGGHRLRPPPAPVRARPRAPPRRRGVLLRLPLRSLHRVHRAYQVHTCLVALRGLLFLSAWFCQFSSSIKLVLSACLLRGMESSAVSMGALFSYLKCVDQIGVVSHWINGCCRVFPCGVNTNDQVDSADLCQWSSSMQYWASSVNALVTLEQ
jgi:hypothetical protein